MRKTISNTSVILLASITILMFVTAKSYLQLASASVFYLPLVFLLYRMFVHQDEFPTKTITMKVPARLAPTHKKSKEDMKSEEIVEEQPVTKLEVHDIDKRAFLKLVAGAGISFLFFSLINKKTNSLFGNNSPLTSNGSDAVNQHYQSIAAASGYKITEIDNGATTYYGFTNTTGGWMIMKEDSDTNSYRYARGDNNFPTNWDNRENIKYGYYYQVFGN